MIKEYNSIKDMPKELLTDEVRYNLFFSDDYASCVDAEGRKMLLLASDEYLVPFVLTRKMIFKYGAFAYQPVNFRENANQSTEEFVDEVIDYLAKKRHIHFITPTPAYTCFNSYPSNSKRIPFGNYVCDLSASEDELFAKLHSKHRNCVRKAKKDGVLVKNGCDEVLLAEYMSMDVETWARSKKSSSGEAFYKTKLTTLPQNARIFIAYKNDVPQSGALIYYDRLCGYYMFGANKNAPYSGAGNLLQWEIMLWLKANGVKKYSFVGCRINEDEDSKYHNIQRFKERFGGDLITGFMFKCVCNNFMYSLFLLALKLRGASAGDAIDQEIGKWPELNKKQFKG